MPSSLNPIVETLQKVGLTIFLPLTVWAFTLSSDVKVLQTQQSSQEQLDSNRDKKLELIVDRQEKILIQQERQNAKLEEIEKMLEGSK